VGMVVNRGRQLESFQRPLTPGETEIATKILQDKQGRTVF